MNFLKFGDGTAVETGIGRVRNPQGFQQPPQPIKEDDIMASWDLFRELESITRDMDHMLRGFGFGRALEPSFATALGSRNYPRINLREDGDNLYVEALLPGVDAKSLDMTVLQNTLTLDGERKNGIENVSWHRRERGVGRFLRTIDLPAEIDVDQVEADYRDGVLTVTLPKAATAKPKRIEIKAN
jgi:HSP20 family protein